MIPSAEDYTIDQRTNSRTLAGDAARLASDRAAVARACAEIVEGIYVRFEGLTKKLAANEIRALAERLAEGEGVA